MTIVTDINGDGLSDIVYGHGIFDHEGAHCFGLEYQGELATWRLLLNQGDMRFTHFDTGLQHGCMASLLPVDLDGDSLPEILYRGGATRMMFNALSFDFDEDQQPSVESTPTNLGYVVQQPANGVTIARYTSVANAQARLIDLNGDGLKDIVRDAGIGNHEVAQLNLGAGRFSDPLEIIDRDDVAIGITLDEPSPSKCVVE